MDITMETARELLALAGEVRQRAHAPYSGFKVGAALLAADGMVYQGCNVENSSYSLTCCAERTAMFHAVSEGQSDFLAVAIAADGDAVPPCGACRQVLSEFSRDLTVILADADGKPRILSLTNLLPEPFTADFLSR
jgi:cytidine deaminase